MKTKKLDLRRVTKQNLENNITGRTKSGAYFADINGVEVLFVYRNRLDDCFYPARDKNDIDCDCIYVYVDFDYYGSGIFDNLVKIIQF